MKLFRFALFSRIPSCHPQTQHNAGNLSTNEFSQLNSNYTETFSGSCFVKRVVQISELVSQKMFGELIVKSKGLQRCLEKCRLAPRNSFRPHSACSVSMLPSGDSEWETARRQHFSRHLDVSRRVEPHNPRTNPHNVKSHEKHRRCNPGGDVLGIIERGVPQAYVRYMFFVPSFFCQRIPAF